MRAARHGRGRPGPPPAVPPPTWAGSLTAWSKYLRASGASPGTITTRTSQLRRFADWFGGTPDEVTTDVLVEYLALRKWSVESRRCNRAAFRVFFKWAHRHGSLAADPADELPGIRPAVAVARAASGDDIARALALASPRVSLLIRLAAEMGLRRAEAVQVHARDVRQTPDGFMLIVHGKGAKDRVIPVPESLAGDLREIRGFLFPAPGGGHLTAGAAGRMVSECLPPGVSMHSLRHAFATAIYQTSRDLIATQTLLGHSKPETTRGYVAFDPTDLRAVVNDAITAAASTRHKERSR